MALVYKDRVKETTTTTGTGTLTLAGAASGYQAFSSVGDGNTCVYGLEASDGGWEVGIGTYTLSGTTLARTTILASSNSGSAITLPAGTHNVYVTAESSALRNGFLRSKASSADAAVTGEVGTMHMLDISGFSANRDFTLPAVAAVGDRVAVTLTGGDDTYSLIIKPAAGDTINGGSAGAEWSRLFIRGETVIFRCTTADSAWEIEIDGRIPCKMVLTVSTASLDTTTATWLVPTATSTAGAWTATINTGNCGTTANGRFTPRRDGTLLLTGRGSSDASVSANKYWRVQVRESVTTTNTWAISNTVAGSAASVLHTSYSGVTALATGTAIELAYMQEEASDGLNEGSTFCVLEQL